MICFYETVTDLQNWNKKDIDIFIFQNFLSNINIDIDIFKICLSDIDIFQNHLAAAEASRLQL